MKIEHVALNVPDSLALARWYVEHLGFTVKRRTVDPPYVHFLADDSDAVMLEVYSNPQASVPEYKEMDPLALHLALSTLDIQRDLKRLVAAGATVEAEVQTTAKGDQLAMLRDPWGIALQLVSRQESMI